MALDWSRDEVEATVSDYFSMLEQELRGQPYNKTVHRRGLTTLLNGRTDGAIERKHQNISAILIELGFVYISGYKPLANYQQMLFDAVESRLQGSLTLQALVRQQVEAPAPMPSVDDILASLVSPPTPDPDRHRYRATTMRERAPSPRRIDYVALESKNQSLGAAGEELVTRYEVARLLSLGHARLAAQVEHVSRTKGDGLGFDVLSFEASGRERFIEVKTTNYGALTPFFVSRAESRFSRDTAEQFYLYRAFDFRRSPRFFCKQGAIEQAFRLEPSQFLATLS